MAKQTINIGAAPNDGSGDTLRTGGDKINQNFTEVYNGIAYTDIRIIPDANYTLLDSDSGDTLYFTNACIIAGGDLTPGFTATLYKIGTGNIQFVPNGGTLLESVGDTITTQFTAMNVTYRGGTPKTWNAVGAFAVAGGGITNIGAADEVVKSDGVNIVGTKIYNLVNASLALGSAVVTGAVRTISAINSTSDAALLLLAQGLATLRGVGLELDSLTGKVKITQTPADSSSVNDHIMVRDVTSAELEKLGIGAGLSIQTAKLVTAKYFTVAASDETSLLTVGTGKITFRMPHQMTLTEIRASLNVAQAAGSIFTVNVKLNGASILSTKITIDNNEKTSTTAATLPVISNNNLLDDGEITVDIDQIGTSLAKGLKITFIGY